MNAKLDYIGHENARIAQDRPNIKHLIAKLGKAIAKVTTFDADAIFKSKDWPCLWTK